MVAELIDDQLCPSFPIFILLSDELLSCETHVLMVQGALAETMSPVMIQGLSIQPSRSLVQVLAPNLKAVLETMCRFGLHNLATIGEW